MSSPPTLVTSFAAPPSDSSHGPLPAVRATTLPPPSLLQPPPHPNRSHCTVRVSLLALVTLSACRRHCRHDPLIALTTLVAPSATRSCCAVPPPAQKHRARRSCRDVPMQKSQDTDVNVNVGVDCICLTSSNIGEAALPRPFPRCSRRSPLLLLLSSSSSPSRSRHCCHPYNCGADAAR